MFEELSKKARDILNSEIEITMTVRQFVVLVGAFRDGARAALTADDYTLLDALVMPEGESMNDNMRAEVLASIVELTDAFAEERKFLEDFIETRLTGVEATIVDMLRDAEKSKLPN